MADGLLQAVLEAEMTAHLHAEPYERSAERRGYRYGVPVFRAPQTPDAGGS